MRAGINTPPFSRNLLEVIVDDDEWVKPKKLGVSTRMGVFARELTHPYQVAPAQRAGQTYLNNVTAISKGVISVDYGHGPKKY